MKMNEQELGERARIFAKNYVAIVDALMKEGVPEPVARTEARATALDMMFEVVSDGEPCPLCGRC